MQQQGVYTKTLIAFENEGNYGKDPANVATASKNMPFNSNSLSANQNTTAPGTITGRRDPVEPIMGNIDVSGEIVVPVDGNALGYWLTALFGTPTTTAGDTSGTYKHVFKPSNRQPSLVIEKAYPDINVFAKYNGCKLSSFNISAGGDGELTATIGIMGANETINDTSMATNAEEVALERFNNFMITAFEINGEEVAIATEVTMNMDNGLDGDTYTVGSKGFRTGVNEGILAISGSMTAFFNDAKYIEYAENSDTISAELIMETGDFKLSFLYPEMKLARNTPSIEGPTGIRQQLDYNAFYKNNAENSSVVITLINKHESYAIE